MKADRILLAILILCATSCVPRHHHGCGFISDPDFSLFGASLHHDGGRYIVKSYIRSEAPFRTEYIYENFDIFFPDTFKSGKKYDISEKGVGFTYVMGGQGGQIETVRGKGTFSFQSPHPDTLLIDLDLVFTDFTLSGGHMDMPESTARKGRLKAEKGYRLY